MASRVVLIENLMNCCGSSVRCGTASCDCSAAPQFAQGSPTWTLENGLEVSSDIWQNPGDIGYEATIGRSSAFTCPTSLARRRVEARVPGGVFASSALGQLRLPPEI